MRPVREVTAEAENFRMETRPGSPFHHIRRDPVEPEPVGTILLVPMRIVGYDPDCDGSLMARMERLAFDERLNEPIEPEVLHADMRTAQSYGVSTNHGLYPDSGIIVTVEEARALWKQAQTNGAHA